MSTDNRNQDDRIIDLLGEGPLVALYFTIAINVLCQVVDKSDDEFVHALFGRLIPSSIIRKCIHDMDRKLNAETDTQKAASDDTSYS